MNFLWGGLMLLIGLFILVSALTKSEFVVYRYLVKRSEVMWKDNVYKFHTVVGVILMAFSLLFFFGVF